MRGLMLGVAALAMAVPIVAHSQGTNTAPAYKRKVSPSGYPPSWFTDKDYPREARERREQGSVAFLMTVDKKGKPAACTVTSSSGSASLDAKTCELAMKRARFYPALDADGRPVESKYPMRTTWSL